VPVIRCPGVRELVGIILIALSLLNPIKSEEVTEVTKLQWREVEATATIDLDDVTAGGPDYDPEEIGDIVVPSQADTDYGIGYALDGTPVLIDGEGYGYRVPTGAIYAQPYGGRAYEVVEAVE
jgi:hypothetical protein